MEDTNFYLIGEEELHVGKCVVAGPGKAALFVWATAPEDVLAKLVRDPEFHVKKFYRDDQKNEYTVDEFQAAIGRCLIHVYYMVGQKFR
jgi:hypothetical protein